MATFTVVLLPRAFYFFFFASGEIKGKQEKKGRVCRMMGLIFFLVLFTFYSFLLFSWARKVTLKTSVTRGEKRRKMPTR